MNKKIKIIELLNKIASGEELPKNIKVKNKEYYLDGSLYFTVGEDDEDLFNLMSYMNTFDFLKSEVEILEDNTEEIEEKSNFENMGYEIAQAYFEFYKGIAKALAEKRKESEDKQ